ncbi:MAG: DUF6492 family protein [Desulfomonilaceae bacterium]
MKTVSQIGVVIPYHPKDRQILPWCVQGIRRNVDHSRILVICHEECRSDIDKAGAVFVDEDEVIGGLTFRSFSGRRWNWYFQQILKLGAADLVKTPYYLAADSDTVFLRRVLLACAKLAVQDNHHQSSYMFWLPIPRSDWSRQTMGIARNRNSNIDMLARAAQATLSRPIL